MLALPPDFRQRIINTFGEPGAVWLKRLPDLLAETAALWEVELGEPYRDLSYNYVARGVRQDGRKVALKIGVPNRELLTEISALSAYEGRGAVELLAASPETGALLLARLEPGTPLFYLGDDQVATGIAIHVMRELRSASYDPNDFPTVRDWARGMIRLREQFNGSTGPFPKDLVEAAEFLFHELINSMESVTLLHGDLHHWNILNAGEAGWRAIDPKGIIAEPAYEVGTWLRNPYPNILKHPRPQRLIARRIDQLSEALGVARQRLWDWGLAQAVLSAWWSFEDGGSDWKQGLYLARCFMQ